MCVLALVQTGVACARVQCSEELEKEIKAAKTIKKIIIRNKKNKKYVDEFKTSISANIEEIENACSRGKYSNKNIVINQPATDEEMIGGINLLKIFFSWLPDDLVNCTPKGKLAHVNLFV